MHDAKVCESTVGSAPLEWFEGLGYNVLSGPQIARGEPVADGDAKGHPRLLGGRTRVTPFAARPSQRLMSGRNIVLFQELRDALAGQLQTPGTPGPDERELDPLLTDRLCLGRSAGGNDHFRAFRQSEVALQDDAAVVDATTDFHTRILRACLETCAT